MKSPTLPSPQRLLLSAIITISLLASRGNSFQTNRFYQSCRTRTTTTTTPATPSSSATTRVRMLSTSFQQARLAEQLRLFKRGGTQKEDIASNGDGNSDATTATATATTIAETTSELSTSTELLTEAALEEAAREEAQNILKLENEAASMMGSEDMPLAPMMTYQKYLTMQEKRVRVTIRYSAEAGLRPFYLTVANQIKSAYPDVLLEKRILSPLGSDASPGAEPVFEVVVDGKTVIGKKNGKMLKVTSRSSQTNNADEDDDSEKKKKGGAEKKKGGAKSGNGDDGAAPDIAGGRSVFVSMEKLEQELNKARKRRRPNTMYKSKEIVAVDGTSSSAGTGRAGGAESPGMTEAVLRLEKLKAMSTRNKI